MVYSWTPAEIMARCISAACNLLNPEAFVIAGRLISAGELLMTPLREFLSPHVLIPLEENEMGPKTRLLTASLGRDASALGARRYGLGAQTDRRCIAALTPTVVKGPRTFSDIGAAATQRGSTSFGPSLVSAITWIGSMQLTGAW